MGWGRDRKGKGLRVGNKEEREQDYREGGRRTGGGGRNGKGRERWEGISHHE